MDVILVSYAKNKKLKKITECAVKSIDKKHNIIIIESNPNARYKNTTTIYPKFSFNYNKYLNMGAKSGSNEFIFFGNNDLIFEKSWDVELQRGMLEYSLSSASPICLNTHSKFGIYQNTGVLFGYDVYIFFCGWAFVWQRSLYEKMGGLDETFNFWCSDNAVINQLKKDNIKHGLVTSSIVHHLNGGGNTLNYVRLSEMKSYTLNEIKKYNRLYNANLQIENTWELPDKLKKELFPEK